VERAFFDVEILVHRKFQSWLQSLELFWFRGRGHGDGSQPRFVNGLEWTGWIVTRGRMRPDRARQLVTHVQGRPVVGSADWADLLVCVWWDKNNFELPGTHRSCSIELLSNMACKEGPAAPCL
jgi:hypothetical protein